MTRDPIEAYVSVASERLARFIGIDLGRGGIARTVRHHVQTRVQALGDPGARRYGSMLDDPRSPESEALVEAATVPHSWLFRDEVQLEAVTQALEDRPRGRLSIWVAGCASGEDAVTFAAIARSLGHEPTVLATDVNRRAMARAAAGRFDAWRSRDLPAHMRRFFREDGAGAHVVTPELARTITYRRHSLLDPFPRPEGADGFDLIVCRNVLIYFGREDALRIVSQLAARLSVGGLLVLGTSDVLADLPRTLAPRAGTRLVLVRSDRLQETRPARRPVALPQPHVGALPPSAEPVSVDVYVAMIAALESGDLARARDLAEARFASHADAEAALLAGLAHRALAQQERAAAHLERACRLASGCWVAWLHLGLTYEGLGRFEAARDALRRVPLADGPGADLPRGTSALAISLHESRKTFARFAIARAASIERGGTR